MGFSNWLHSHTSLACGLAVVASLPLQLSFDSAYNQTDIHPQVQLSSQAENVSFLQSVTHDVIQLWKRGHFLHALQ